VGCDTQDTPQHQVSQYYFGYLIAAVAVFESAVKHLKYCEDSQYDIAEAIDMAHRIKGNAAMYGYIDLGLRAGKLEALMRADTYDRYPAHTIFEITEFIELIHKVCHDRDSFEPAWLKPTLATTNEDSAGSQSPASASGRKSILVAYKDAWLSDFIASLLEPEFVVISCRTKDALFNKVKHYPIDLLILENSFCDESGTDLLKLFKAEPATKDLPIFLAFDADMPEAIAEAISIGVDGFAEDKLEILDVVNSVRNYINKPAKSILVVDDDPVVQQLLTQALKSSGLQVDLAKDGIDALNYLSDNTPDLILLDRFMPRLEGGTVLYEIKNKINLKSIPVLILTSMVNQGEAKSWFERGAADFIPKPFDPEEVVMRVKKHLDIRYNAHHENKSFKESRHDDGHNVHAASYGRGQ
jgi:DNA-binding response OmpR family regulator/HPt (histidine-containing phosphotransfer) domain-containing protein